MKRRTFLTGTSMLGLPALATQVSADSSHEQIAPDNTTRASVRDFGARGDGQHDDSAAIQRAVDASHVVFFPEGDYLVRTRIDLRSGSSLVGDGAATLRTDGTSMILNAVGRIGSATPLTSDVHRGDTSINASADLVDQLLESGGFFLQSDEQPLGHATHLAGEIGLVSTARSESAEVAGAILADYRVGMNGKISPLQFIHNISIRGLSFRNDNYEREPNAATSAFIYLEFVNGFQVSDCSLQENNGAGIAAFNCLNGRINSNQIGKLRDSGSTILGYGVQAGFSSQNISVVGNNFFECRHAVTTGTGSRASRTPNYGVSRGLAIIGNTVANCTHAGLDTHEDSDGVTISGNTVTACSPVGIHVRSYNSAICGNSIYACRGKGIRVSRTAKSTVVSGNIIRGIRRDNSDGDGIVVDGINVTVCGNEISDCDRHGIIVEQNARRGICLTGNACRDTGLSGSGIGIFIDRRNIISELTVVGNSCTVSGKRAEGKLGFLVSDSTTLSADSCRIASNNFSSDVRILTGRSSRYTVAGARLIRLVDTADISELGGGTLEQTIKILSSRPVTIIHSPSIRLQGDKNFRMRAGDTLELSMFEKDIWRETGRNSS